MATLTSEKNDKSKSRRGFCEICGGFLNIRKVSLEMSIDIRITQKGLLKRTLPLHVITGSDLCYGTSDGMKLKENDLSSDEIIMYHSNHISRGFSIEWTPEKKDYVDLRALSPDSREGLNDFFAAIQRIASYWKCEIEMDGNITALSELVSLIPDMQAFNETVLESVCGDILSGKKESLTLYSVMFPVVLGVPEAEKFRHDVDAFGRWLHEKQSVDAYYARPQFFRTEVGVVGRYVVTEDCRTIFPLKGQVPLGISDPETGKGLKCDRYEVYFYSISQEKMLGYVPFETFIEIIKEQAERFDGANIIFEGLSMEALQKIVETAV